jgi:hypothetical protein
MMRKVRRPERRKALRAEIKARLAPRLGDLGFESTRTQAGRMAWPGIARQGFGYARRRNGRIDRLEVVWDEGGRDWFYIYFSIGWAESPTCMGETISGEIQPARSSGFLKLIGVRERWFGRGHSHAEAVDLAIEGVEDLDRFLREGERSAHILIRQVGYQGASSPFNNLDFLVLAIIVLIFPPIVPIRLLTVSEEGARPRRIAARDARAPFSSDP